MRLPVVRLPQKLYDATLTIPRMQHNKINELTSRKMLEGFDLERRLSDSSGCCKSGPRTLYLLILIFDWDKVERQSRREMGR
jgi:hypothetical protein